MSARNEYAPDPTQMASLLDMSDARGTLFGPEELAAILHHQLAAPIECDLRGTSRDRTLRLTTCGSSQDLPLETFADLLRHPQPPLELLEIAKQFAKSKRNDPEGGVPAEIATLLYYACIATALVRYQERITELDGDALKKGFKWAQQQPWVNAETATLIQAGVDYLDELGGQE